MADSNKSLVLPAPSGPAQPGTASTTEDIRPLKGPVVIPSSYAWLWWLLVSVAVAAIAYFLKRRFRGKQALSKPAVTISPHRKAKDRLRAADELMSDPYKFCFFVSDVLRTYVEERFSLHAPDRTTEEFMDELRRAPQLHPAHKSLLEDFLARCDLVKFARAEPTEPELRSLLDSALRFVDETAPSETASMPEEKAAA